MIIDDDSFALGMPMEMREQHALLLQGENEQLQFDLSRTRKSIEKVVAIWTAPAVTEEKLNAVSGIS
ncbi:hypothetical protein D3C77_635710 [compost metagenome]